MRVNDVAASLYIHPFMLSRWRKATSEGKILTNVITVGPAVEAGLTELQRPTQSTAGG